MKHRYLLQVALLGVLVAFPWLPQAERFMGGANQAAVFTIVAASLVLLTGWVGQISLGHAALVGIGAYATGWATAGLDVPFPYSLVIGAGVAGLTAALLGIVALRVRGLYLAVATLVFSWAASEYLFRAQWVLKHYQVPANPVGREGTIPFFDFSGSRRAYYYIVWGIAVAILYGLSNIRDSRTGRAFFAIRGSEMAAASLGIDVLRYKALSFAMSGVLAGVAGNLIMTHALVVSPEQFDFNSSLFFLSIAVVGGLASLPGAVAASMLFASLSEVFFRVRFLGEYLQLVSTGLLAFTFRVYPSGLAGLGRSIATATGPTLTRLSPGLIAAGGRLKASFAPLGRKLSSSTSGVRSAVRRWMAKIPFIGVSAERTEEPLQFGRELADGELQIFPSENGSMTDQRQPPLSIASFRADEQQRLDPSSRHNLRPLIEAQNIVVKFGGLVAVNDATLSVREGEIVGLIGPNGAGKTTLFNSIAGFNTPVSGTVKLYGVDVTALPVHKRAQLGIARTFQLIQLFPQLTVFDNLLAATHLQNETGFMRHMMVTGKALHAESSAQFRVNEVIDLLDLRSVAFRKVAGLPFGILRMVEVARALVTGARVIMLDEPASGLDNRETDNLIDVLRFVRGLGATLLLIEHDVRMVTGVSDYMYVLNRGTMIAEGPSALVQSHPEVIAAYLGKPVAEAVNA